MKPTDRKELFARLAELNPNPTTELVYRTPFELLVAVILSAQATDVGVNKATRKLFQGRQHAGQILALGEDGLKKYISTSACSTPRRRTSSRPVGCWSSATAARSRATREALEALPGVGRKTANVVLNTAFGEPTIAVDTHIFRVANRTGLAPGKNVRAVEDKLHEGRARRVIAGRPPLADPARPLCLQGPQARLPAVCDPRPVRLSAQDQVFRAVTIRTFRGHMSALSQ